MAKLPVPTQSLEELKIMLQGLKTRADALNLKRDALVREATIQEQNQDRALKELADLGYPEAAKMDLTALATLGSDLLTQLNGAIGDLTKAVDTAEQTINGQSTTAVDLD